jgi:DNA polymerase
MKLSKLAKEIKRCKKCDLWENRINAVPGEGPENAKILFIGQAPGRNENLQGKPFVGMAGKFLDKLFNSIGIKRKKVFITGAVKCFPPKNRRPTKHEIEACKPYLLKQIEIIKPKLIVLLGDVALETLLGKNKISKIHGKPIRRNKIIYFPTFHPAAAMRFPKIREKMLKDFEKLKLLLNKLKLR